MLAATNMYKKKCYSEQTAVVHITKEPVLHKKKKKPQLQMQLLNRVQLLTEHIKSLALHCSTGHIPWGKKAVQHAIWKTSVLYYIMMHLLHITQPIINSRLCISTKKFKCSSSTFYFKLINFHTPLNTFSLQWSQMLY